jgi:TetR/AcrR family transcriptional regulator, transcriptional repressor for nem operon
MRYSSDHKARTRERLLTEAAAAVRSEGLDAVSVSSVMGRAGLTNGGFYAHFANREDMLAAAIAEAFADRRGQMRERLAEMPPEEALRVFVRFYLSLRHVDNVERGCPIPTLAGQAHRHGEPVRAALSAGADGLITTVAGWLERAGRAPDIAPALVAQMVGAVALARAMPDATARGTFLACNRDSILEQALGHDEGTPADAT